MLNMSKTYMWYSHTLTGCYDVFLYIYLHHLSAFSADRLYVWTKTNLQDKCAALLLCECQHPYLQWRAAQNECISSSQVMRIKTITEKNKTYLYLSLFHPFIFEQHACFSITPVLKSELKNPTLDTQWSLDTVTNTWGTLYEMVLTLWLVIELTSVISIINAGCSTTFSKLFFGH